MRHKPMVAEEIERIIRTTGGWRGARLASLRSIIRSVDGVTEAVKWKMPSKPLGVPVWVAGGQNVCIADTLKAAVRLTFPSGAELPDRTHLFNARLESKSVRAIDVHESDTIDPLALADLITAAVANATLNENDK